MVGQPGRSPNSAMSDCRPAIALTLFFEFCFALWAKRLIKLCYPLLDNPPLQVWFQRRDDAASEKGWKP
jgi:hypothetical protein